MKIYERLLVATDFSPASEPALREAERMARASGAGLTILHAFQVPAFASVPEAPLGAYPPGTHEDFVRAVRTNAEKHLEAAVARARADGVDARGVLREGFADEEVLAQARAEGVDLIVMGTHGRRGLSRVFLGSVAAGVVSRADCPVLTVRAQADESDAPGRRSIRRGPARPGRDARAK